MSKKIVTITKQGVRESISGNSQQLPSSAELKFQNTALIQDVLAVAQGATGTVSTEAFVQATGRSLVVLPASPTSGQRVLVAGSGAPGSAIGVSASHFIANPLSTEYAMDVSSSNYGFIRSFNFVSAGGGSAWLTEDNGGGAGTTGSYSF